ncbi:SIMPL domain-containing protein [Actinomycetota bacterium]
MSEFVEVSGIGSASGVPDMALLDISVRAEAASVGAALSEMSERASAVTAAARAQGLADADLSTTSSSAQPRWDAQGQHITGYSAWTSLRLRIRDLARVSPMVSALAEAGGDAFGVDTISLAIADTTALAAQAREAAYADARTKAEQYAVLAGRELGAVLVVADVPAPAGPRPMMRMAAESMSMAGMPVEAGEASVAASVTVRWAWAR